MEDPKNFYFSNINDVASWDLPHVKSATVSKWRWLWRQFLCVAGLSKRPQMLVTMDMGKDGDATVEVTAFINESGDLEINEIKEIRPICL